MMKKKLRTKEEIQNDITSNYLMLADFIVRKSGPVKTYSAFCEMTGLHSQNFSSIQKRERNVPMDVAVKACEVTGCSYSFMFGNMGEIFGKDDVMRRVLDLEERIVHLERSLFGKNGDAKKPKNKT